MSSAIYIEKSSVNLLRSRFHLFSFHAVLYNCLKNLTYFCRQCRCRCTRSQESTFTNAMLFLFKPICILKNEDDLGTKYVCFLQERYSRQVFRNKTDIFDFSTSQVHQKRFRHSPTLLDNLTYNSTFFFKLLDVNYISCFLCSRYCGFNYFHVCVNKTIY